MQNFPTNRAGLGSTWTVRIALARLQYELHEASDWGSNFRRLVTCVASALLFEGYGDAEAVTLRGAQQQPGETPRRCRSGLRLKLQGFQFKTIELVLVKEGPPEALDMQGTVYL